MKGWHRYVIGLLIGVAVGGGAAWLATDKALGSGGVVNGQWTTALNYGTAGADPMTRAVVARRGLLALPSTETVYWNASADSEGRPFDGNCTYAMTGRALDARWWSVTYYDKKGYLVANPANIWSFSGARINDTERAGWRVTIAPEKPQSGHWLPSAKGQGFDLTLRLYNPGAKFRAAPDTSELPLIRRERCA